MEIQYFFSPTCTICDTQKIILAKLETELNIPISNFNIFTDLDKALRFGINSAPAISLLVEGRSVEVMTGFQSREHIANRIEYWRSFLN